MISAEKAREITAVAQEQEQAYIDAVVRREVEDACELIRQSACGKNRACNIPLSIFIYPSEVKKFLETELGYTVSFSSHNTEMRIVW